MLARVCLVCALPLLPALAGCQLIGGMMANQERFGSTTVEPAYTGLEGKTFAVVVSADRGTQSEHPLLVERIADEVTKRLANPANFPRAGGFVPAAQVMEHLYRTPGWAAKPVDELARELGGVQRLVLVELIEYRLHEPGNTYEWDGVAALNVTVHEIDGPSPEAPVFSRNVSARFPLERGITPEQLERVGMTSELSRRAIDRAAGLFYRHDVPNSEL